MTGHPDNATTKELLERRIFLLERKVTRLGEHLSALWDSFMEERRDQDERHARTFERIKNLEVAVFPNLPKDIERVHQIIGGDGVPAEKNPLDSRKTSPRKADREPGSI
jgi:hypothetical protein